MLRILTDEQNVRLAWYRHERCLAFRDLSLARGVLAYGTNDRKSILRCERIYNEAVRKWELERERMFNDARCEWAIEYSRNRRHKIKLRERSHKFLVESAKLFELYRKGSEA